MTFNVNKRLPLTFRARTKKATLSSSLFDVWLREPDLNRRPSGYEPDELPDCSIPRLCGGILQRFASVSTADLDKSVEVQALSVFSGRATGAQGKWRKGFSSIAR